MKPSKNNLHHLFHSYFIRHFSAFGIIKVNFASALTYRKGSFRSVFLFSSVMYLQYTPSSQRNLYSKIKDKSEAVYFFQVSNSQRYKISPNTADEIYASHHSSHSVQLSGVTIAVCPTLHLCEFWDYNPKS